MAGSNNRDNRSQISHIRPSVILVGFAVSVKNINGTPIPGALVVWEDGERSETNRNGIGRHKPMGKSSAPSYMKCSISMLGYKTEDFKVGQNKTAPVVLQEENINADYYSFHTVDERNKYIPYVEVEIYPIGG